MAPDFSTPEGAILKLEDAYRRKDLDAAVAAKSFPHEARMILAGKNPDLLANDDIVAQLAQVLEAAFRKEMQTKGFPDMTGLECTFSSTEKRDGGIAVVTEICRYPDGGSSTQRMQVVQTDRGWRVLVPLK